MDTSCHGSAPPPRPCRGGLRHVINTTSSSSDTQVYLQINTVTETDPPRAHSTRSPVVFTCGSNDSAVSANLICENTSDSSSTTPYLTTDRVLPELPSPCTSREPSPCHVSGCSRPHIVPSSSHSVQRNQRQENHRANFNVSSARPSLPSIAEDRIVVCPVCPTEMGHDAQCFHSSPNSGVELPSNLSHHRRLPLSCQSMQRIEHVRSHSENLLSSGTSADNWSTSSATSFLGRHQQRRWKSRSRKWCLMLTVVCIFVVITAAFLIVTVLDFVQRGKQEDTNREAWTMSSKVLEFLKTSQEQGESRRDETCLPCLELFCTENASMHCQDLRLLQKSLNSATLRCCTRNPSHVVNLLTTMAEGRQKELGFTIKEAVRNATASLVNKPKAYATVVVKKPNSSSPGPQEAILQEDHHFAVVSNVSVVHNRLYIHTPGLYLVSGQVLFRSTSGRLEDDLTLTVERYNLRQGKARVLTQSRYTPPGGQGAPVWYRTMAVVLPTLLEQGDELALLVSPPSLVSQQGSNYFSVALVSSVSDRK